MAIAEAAEAAADNTAVQARLWRRVGTCLRAPGTWTSSGRRDRALLNAPQCGLGVGPSCTAYGTTESKIKNKIESSLFDSCCFADGAQSSCFEQEA